MIKNEPCKSCKGSGVLTKTCRRCGGKKFVNGEVCSLCRGTGVYVFMKNQRRKEELICPTCNGSGQKKKRRDGQRVLTMKQGERAKNLLKQ